MEEFGLRKYKVLVKYQSLFSSLNDLEYTFYFDAWLLFLQWKKWIAGSPVRQEKAGREGGGRGRHAWGAEQGCRAEPDRQTDISVCPDVTLP